MSIIQRRFALLLPLLCLVTAVTSAAQERATGFRLPPDFEREFAEKVKVYDPDKVDLPSFFSWETQDGITSVKDQGGCGSCWAFAATAQIEAHMKIFYGVDMDLSEQQGIFCNSSGADCDGGWASAVYGIAMNNGLVREAAMPYQGVSNGACVQGDFLDFARVLNWHYVQNNVEQIKLALLDGPVCTALNADDPLPGWGGSCYDVDNGTWTNHLVLIVGWDDRICGGNGGWICKNSWGTSFGDGGYWTQQYGVSGMGISTTQIQIRVPDARVFVMTPAADRDYAAGEQIEITWATTGAAVTNVDIWCSLGGHFDTRIVQNTPNDGSFTWTLPNESVDRLEFCIVADGNTDNGFGFLPDPIKLIGHRTRYVSSAGSDTPPYESPATAAHHIADAVAACTGRDSVLVVGGDYSGTIIVTRPALIIGGWDPTFASRDTRATPTRLSAVGSALKFTGDLVDEHAGVLGVEFHDCIGTVSSTPQFGRHGGAIYINGAAPLIRDCVFTDNAANFPGDFGVGGAVFGLNGSPRIEDCVFTGGRADHGGAVALYGSDGAVFAGNTFTANVCTDSTAGHFGAAVYLSNSDADFDGDVFTGQRRTSEGAAIYAIDSAVVARDIVCTGNTAEQHGAALSVHGGSLVLEGAMLADGATRVSGGAGLYATGAAVMLRNSTLTGNAAGGLGAGFYLENAGPTTVENCLLSGNVSGSAIGGGFILGADVFTFRNNVVCGNGGGVGGSVGSYQLDHNLFWDTAGADYLGFTPGGHDLAAAPGFVDAAAGDYALALHSPCLDRGDPDPACADLDGSRCDMGPCGGPLSRAPAPPAVRNATLETAAGTFLRWDLVSAPDIVQYVVYSTGEAELLPGPDMVIGTVAHPAHVLDLAGLGAETCYVVALDAAGRVGGYSEPVAVTTTAVGDLPTRLGIAAITPNPFNPRTTVAFDLPRSGPVRVTIHDMRGRVVRTLVDGPLEAGRRTVVWDGHTTPGGEAAAGVYLLRVDDGVERRTAKLLLAK